MTTTVNRWGENGPRPEPNHELDPLFAGMTARAEVTVSASPDMCWALVSDIGRIGEFSPECIGAQWLPGTPTGQVGARFEGTNRSARGDDVFEWIRVCEVLAWDPPLEFAYVVGDRYDGTPVSRWQFTIVPGPEGTRIVQEFSHYPDGLSGIRGPAESDPTNAQAFIAARRAELESGMQQTLARMREVLERGPAS